MKKSICIFTLSLLFMTGLYLIPVDDAYAGERHRDRRAKRAYVAGAVRGKRRANRHERREDRNDYRNERREDRHDYRNERRERHERRETRRSIATGAIAVGVGAAVIRNSRERRERY